MYRVFGRKKMVEIILSIATFLSLVLQVVAGNANPPIPYQIPKFQSRVEINQPDSGFSTGVEEFYDGENNRSAIIITQMGRTNRIIHDRMNQEILNIEESIQNKRPAYTCTVEKRSQDVEISDFINPSWLLREVTESKETYVPNAKPIRGIPVNHWRANIVIEDGNLTVDYFYSELAWRNNYKLNQVPVRVSLSDPFNVDYDYYDFLDDVPDESVFQTPDGAYCPNRTSTKRIPSIPDQVSYRVEYNSPIDEVIFSMDVWADTRNHFVRMDYGKYLYSGDNELLTEVHDFNTDLNYKIDRVSRKCEILDMSRSSNLIIDVAKEKSASGGMTIRMLHPYEMFNTNHDFQYSGKKFVYGILCDVFIAQVLNYKISGIPFNVTMEYYFTAGKWEEVSNKELDSEMGVPVFLQIKSLDMSFISNYRYTDFDRGSMYLSAFDVTKCFKPEDKLDFQVDFTHPGQLSMDAKDEIQEKCHLTIAKAASITPLRIEKAKLHFDENYIHFVATLVGLPPAYTQFKLDYECGQFSSKNKMIKNVVTPQDCAELCQEESLFLCNAFSYCKTKKICSLSQNRTDGGQNDPGTFCCSHFSHLKNLKHKWVTSPKAWTNLKNAVYQGKEIVQMGEINIVAVDVKNDVLNGANREISTLNWKNQFSRLKNHVIGGHDALVLSGLAVDDCASACSTEENFYCFSFDFCYSNGECRLSTETSVMNPQYLKQSSTCDVYNRNYESLFDKYPGQTVLPRLNVVYQRVGTAGQCASLCFNYGEFPCKSFDYCELIQTCVLGHTHILDIPKSQVNIEPMCSHYSVKYLADFKKTSKYMLKLADDEVIADISEEECAKICVESDKFICKSFDYCIDSQLCMYRSEHYKPIKGGSILQPSAFCSHYSRKHLPREKNLKPSTTGYSSASMGTLGFFMLIIGIGGSLLAIYLYTRLKRSRRDSLSANMMKDEAIY